MKNRVAGIHDSPRWETQASNSATGKICFRRTLFEAKAACRRPQRYKIRMTMCAHPLRNSRALVRPGSEPALDNCAYID
jgi:hypothetical protein